MVRAIGVMVWGIVLIWIAGAISQTPLLYWLGLGVFAGLLWLVDRFYELSAWADKNPWSAWLFVAGVFVYVVVLAIDRRCNAIVAELERIKQRIGMD